MEETETPFSSKIEYDSVSLEKASDIVRFSFIVQNSLSYLDLSEYSKDGNRSRSLPNFVNEFVCSEEKCRKIFKPDRSLLYTLHLDIAAGIEHSLKKENPQSFPSRFMPQHLGKIVTDHFFYVRIISRFIECALESSDQKIKLLAILQNKSFFKRYLYQVDSPTWNTLVDLFYTKICDSHIFKDFIEFFDLQSWMCEFEKPDILEFLLHHLHFYGRDVETDYRGICVLVDDCIDSSLFLNMKPLFKYTDTSRFCLGAYARYLMDFEDFRPDLNEEVFTETEKLMSKKRIYLIFQILFLWVNSRESRRVEASEALSVLWKTYPDPFACLEEFEMVFAGEISDEDTRDIYKFYCDNIGKVPTCIEPRTLAQLCRTRIRRSLKDNNFWLPEGIALTGLPIPLQSFLNLGEEIQSNEMLQKFS